MAWLRRQKGNTQPVIDKLAAAFKKVYDSPEYQKWTKENSLDLTPGWQDQAAFAALWKDSFATYQDVFTNWAASNPSVLGWDSVAAWGSIQVAILEVIIDEKV